MQHKRKYLGIPTQQEIIVQYNEIASLIKDICTFKQIKEFKEKNPEIEIEVNSECISRYDGEDITLIRYEYKNILVYSRVKDGLPYISEHITLYSDDGDQFGDEKYHNYNNEIERVAKLGCLKLNPSLILS